MRKLTLTVCGALSAASLAVAGVAIAQPGDGPRMKGPTTREQAEQRADAMFARMDANEDGVLNQEDRQARVAQRFAKLDTNSDGSLSLEEFTSGHDKRGGGKFGRKGGGDGKFGGKFGGKGHGMGRGGHGMMAKAADTDNDGQISAAEFQAAALARFDKVDADGDGTISAEERQAMHEARMQSREERRAARQGNTN